jgi:hypothetical protein
LGRVAAVYRLLTADLVRREVAEVVGDFEMVVEQGQHLALEVASGCYVCFREVPEVLALWER